jgi:mRNA interferase MazF
VVILLGSIQDAKPYIQWINETVRLDALASIAKNRRVYRGQVYWCYFGINVGSEQSEKRPCVILQNNQGNINSPNTIVAPITHTKSTLATVVPIADKHDTSGKKVLDGHVLLGNITTISKSRLDSFITDLTTIEMHQINEAIAKSTDIYSLLLKYENQLKGQKKHIDNLMETIKEKDGIIASLEERIRNHENKSL